ncbi:hypothetical protein G8S49_05980 [Clostridium botulinum C]|uniref:Uncharacterized protein n=1 Tax=Clostridium botulinum C TaxID=36828 RepID=A0A9Q3V9E8_CLOBO|nr:hypothetical protein [Clostridium botulinum]MCD3194819.1 hypothetical protein [Clostridium botulinum C]MCD3200246.1 hypothetical protein [Clostridium botulinum C]MCD3205687.1 hypothetical protein [Clostridium botulinum C]MCD3207478.1 hypothetical protein [Clostridium botulinum C]MCD3226212.1 hypothetical protein [Clostridium botulinum C]
MFLGFQPLTNGFFGVNNVIGDINKIIIKDCKMDEIKMDEEILEYIKSKEEWDYNTVMLAKFHNNLSAGNVENNGVKIEKLKLKKRNIENMRWMDVKIFNYDPRIRNYNYQDRLTEALETYEYAVQPMTNGIVGEEITKQIESDFESAWIVGKDTQYQLKYNMNLGDFETVRKVNVFEPLGSRYPIVIENGDINYKKTTLKALLVADTTSRGECQGQVDRKSEKKLRQKIERFFNGGQPFIFKDSSGNYMLAKSTLPIKLIPNNDLSQQLYEINLDVCEIGDCYNTNLLKQYGFIDKEDYR